VELKKPLIKATFYKIPEILKNAQKALKDF